MTEEASTGAGWAGDFPEPVDYNLLLSSFYGEKEAGIDPLSIPREELMGLLVEKHRHIQALMEDERKRLERFISTWEAVWEEKRRKRDELNARVRELKELRGRLHSEMRAVREQFFSLIEKEKALEKEKDRISQLKKEIKGFDWQIETQAVDLDAERELLSRIKNLMEEMTRINEKYREKSTIQERLKGLAEASGKRAAEADRVHMELLDTVEKSNILHG
ncbi:MAG: hypothetical protein J7L61_04390, partial [Thermoplasmata archaeon]|nr:hypothetical protein [Thermoplasmata archaeon]